MIELFKRVKNEYSEHVPALGKLVMDTASRKLAITVLKTKPGSAIRSITRFARLIYSIRTFSRKWSMTWMG